MARVFGRAGGDHDLLLWAGLVCCALGVASIVLALRTPASDGQLSSLLIGGVAVLGGGAAAALLAWHGRRSWVVVDDGVIARPWASGAPRLPLRQLASLRESKSSELVVVGIDGAQLRIDSDLAEFQELLDLLCDRITDNGYPVTTAVWLDGPRAAAVTAQEVTARWAGEGDETRVRWSEVTEVWITRNSKQRLVPALRCKDGAGIKFPHLGAQKTLELYRALRQHMRNRPLPASALREREQRARKQLVRERSVLLRVIALAGLVGATLGAQQSCGPLALGPSATPLRSATPVHSATPLPATPLPSAAAPPASAPAAPMTNAPNAPMTNAPNAPMTNAPMSARRPP